MKSEELQLEVPSVSFSFRQALDKCLTVSCNGFMEVQQSSHLVLQVILPVHLVVRDVEVVIGVVVLKHTAGGKMEEESIPSYPTVLIFL